MVVLVPGIDRALFDIMRVGVLLIFIIVYYHPWFRATVRIALLDMVRKPSERGYHDPTQPMNIITGMGNNSKDGEAVIKVSVACL